MLYDIFFLVIPLISLILGIKNGAAKTLLSVLAFVLTVTITIFASRYLSQLIYTTFIEGALVAKIESFFSESAFGDLGFDSAEFLSAFPKAFMYVLVAFGVTSAAIDSTIAPEDGLLSVEGATSSISGMIEPVITGIITIVLGIILYIVLHFIFRKIAGAAAKVFRLPLLRLPDSLLGGAIGLLKGGLIVVLICAIFTLVLPIIPQTFEFISEDSLAKSRIFSFVADGGLASAISNLIYGL